MKELDRTGLVTARRVSRSIIYTAQYDALGVLLRFLMEDERSRFVHHGTNAERNADHRRLLTSKLPFRGELTIQSTAFLPVVCSLCRQQRR